MPSESFTSFSDALKEQASQAYNNWLEGFISRSKGLGDLATFGALGYPTERAQTLHQLSSAFLDNFLPTQDNPLPAGLMPAGVLSTDIFDIPKIYRSAQRSIPKYQETFAAYETPTSRDLKQIIQQTKSDLASADTNTQFPDFSRDFPVRYLRYDTGDEVAWPSTQALHSDVHDYLKRNVEGYPANPFEYGFIDQSGRRIPTETNLKRDPFHPVNPFKSYIE